MGPAPPQRGVGLRQVTLEGVESTEIPGQRQTRCGAVQGVGRLAEGPFRVGRSPRGLITPDRGLVEGGRIRLHPGLRAEDRRGGGQAVALEVRLVVGRPAVFELLSAASHGA